MKRIAVTYLGLASLSAVLLACSSGGTTGSSGDAPSDVDAAADAGNIDSTAPGTSADAGNTDSTTPGVLTPTFDVTINGKLRKVVAQTTKQGWVYVFDRATGQPVWPIVERPVPQSDVPGEKTSPTQPFPTNPPAFERQGVSEADLIDFTPELHAEALKVIARYKIGPIFTPPIVSRADGLLGILMLPATTGGANWQGGSLDPETGLLYVFSNTEIAPLGLVQQPARSDMRYVEGIARAAGEGGGGGGSRGGGGGGLGKCGSRQT